jgi:hypothetical protein
MFDQQASVRREGIRDFETNTGAKGQFCLSFLDVFRSSRCYRLEVAW